MKEPGYKWMIGPIITIAVLVCGLATSWGVTKTSLDVMKSQIIKVELKLNEHEDKIRDIQIQQAGTNQVLKSIQSSLEEIKEDLRILRSHSKRK
jgi:septal ring factor EnvC (AmiA/AmiB activator)